MSQSTFSDLTGVVVNGIVEAVTGRESLTSAQRDTRAWMVREMVSGLRPGDVRQLMVASQSVLLHVLTIDAAGEEPQSVAVTPKLRTLATVANLNRTMTRNLDTLGRLQAHNARVVPIEPPVDHQPEPTILFRRVVDPVLSGAAAKPVLEAPPPPLNRQQKRKAERDYARLQRRAPSGQTVDRINAR